MVESPKVRKVHKVIDTTAALFTAALAAESQNHKSHSHLILTIFIHSYWIDSPYK